MAIDLGAWFLGNEVQRLAQVGYGATHSADSMAGKLAYRKFCVIGFAPLNMARFFQIQRLKYFIHTLFLIGQAPSFSSHSHRRTPGRRAISHGAARPGDWIGKIIIIHSAGEWCVF